MSLIAHWPLSGDSDDTVRSNHGNSVNVQWADSEFGIVGEFNGVDSYVSIPFNVNDRKDKPHSISGWMSIHDMSVRSVMVGTDVPGVKPQILVDGVEGNVSFLFANETSDHYYSTTAYDYIVQKGVGTWVHLCSVWDGVGTPKFYVNGIRFDHTYAGTGAPPHFSTNLTIGRGYRSTGSRYADVKISDIRLYDHELTFFEVQNLSLGLVAHYPLLGNGHDVLFKNDIYMGNAVYTPEGLEFINKTDYMGSPFRRQIPMSEFSLMLWFKATQEGIVLSMDRSDTWRVEIGGHAGSTAKYVGVAHTVDGTTIDYFDYKKDVVDNTWRHLAFVFGSGKSTLYIDGVSVNQMSSGSKLGLGLVDRELGFGTNVEDEGARDNWPGGFVGKLKDVRLYNREISKETIDKVRGTSVSISSDGSLHGKVKEPTNKLILEDETFPIEDNVYLQLGTRNSGFVETDITSYVETDNTLGNTYVATWVYLSTTKYYPTRFEYTIVNNNKGFTSTISSPVGGWCKGWNYVFFKAAGYSSPSETPWENMTRLQLYRSGETEGVDSGEYIKFKDIRFYKFTDNSPAEPMSMGNVLNAISISEVGLSNGLLTWYPLNQNVEDRVSPVVGIKDRVIVSSEGLVFENGYSMEIQNLPLHNTDFTIACWVKSINNGRFSPIVDQKDWKGFTLAIDWRVGRQESLQWRIPDTNGDVFNLGDMFTGFISNRSGVWTHVVVTYRNGTMFVYRDGEFFQQMDMPSPGHVSEKAMLGVRNTNTIATYEGSMRDLRVYSRSIVPREVKLLYHLTNPTTSSMVVSDNTMYLKGTIKEV